MSNSAAGAIAKRSLLKRPLRWLRPFAVSLFIRGMKLRAVVFREVLRIKLIRLRWRTGKRLLVFVRFGAIGDIVCTFPAAEALITRNPKLHFVYLTLSEFKSLPELGRLAGSVVTSRIHCDVPKLPPWVVEACVQPQYSDEFGTLESSRHLVDEFFSACGLGRHVDEGKAAHLHISSELRAEAIRRIQLVAKSKGPLVAIHTGPTWSVRQWSDEQWSALVQLLSTRLHCRVLHIGASRHVELGDKAIQSIPGTETLLGHLSLPALAAVIEQVDLVVGVDSGILHLAGAVDTPSVGIFGPTNPAFRLPRHAASQGVFSSLPCSFCHHRQPRLHWISGCPYDIACMRGISPESVFAACEAMLVNHHEVGTK